MVVATPVGAAIMLDGTTYDTWGAFIWGPLLLLLAYPLCRWVANKTGEPHIAGFLFGAAALKIVVGAVTRFYMVDAVYGAGDSLRYDDAAAELAGPFRNGIFQDLGEVTGTRFLEIVNGVVQAVIGETLVGSFLVFAAFGFVGMCLLYLAFCEARPNGSRTLYRRLLFLTPTIWFWPSSVGKEAFLILAIGAMAYGFARLLNGHVSGLILAAVGLWGTAVVRPHIALLLALGALAALPSSMRRPSDDQRSSRPKAARLLLPLVVLAALPALLGSVERFFDIEGLNLESANQLRDEVTRRTSKGGSEFVAPDTSNPIGLVQGLVTVAARPFPHEADGYQVLASLETVVLGIVAGIAVFRRRAGLLRLLGDRWVRFSLAYVLGFAWGFSAVANFGILVRQRSLILPFLFVLAAAAHGPRLARDPAVTGLRREGCRIEPGLRA
ncbi:MAG: hypothetical protein ABIX10_07335 [Acidimicrobiales bacterium]